jgi:hypothetical protein
MIIPVPGDSTHWFEGLDLITHFALFGILGGLNRDLVDVPGAARFPRFRVVGILLMIVLPEVLQSGIPTRSFNLLDLMMNGLGTGWGLVIGSYLMELTYLFVSSSLLGFSFGLNVLKQPLESVFFGDFPVFLTIIGLLVPAALLGFLRYRSKIMQFRLGLLLLSLSVLLATLRPQGSAGFLVGLALMAFLLGQLRESQFTAEALTIVGGTGVLLILVGTVIGLESFLATGGLWVVVTILLTSFAVVYLENVFRRADRRS